MTCETCGVFSSSRLCSFTKHKNACKPKACEACGGMFVPRRQPWRTFCSHKCANSRGNTRTHGFARKIPEYAVWAKMKDRCGNPSAKDYHRYGGRGIAVCQRWRDDFALFLADMGRRPSDQHSIDRIDNSGNYEPGNCKWSTVAEQNSNRRPRSCFRRAA